MPGVISSNRLAGSLKRACEAPFILWMFQESKPRDSGKSGDWTASIWNWKVVSRHSIKMLMTQNVTYEICSSHSKSHMLPVRRLLKSGCSCKRQRQLGKTRETSPQYLADALQGYFRWLDSCEGSIQLTKEPASEPASERTTATFLQSECSSLFI
jgi:hypothetical protein